MADGSLGLPGVALRDDMPLYRQVADSLRTSIRAAADTGDAQLPTEQAVARHFGVSRITVRHALQLLESEGLIRKRRAKAAEIVPARSRLEAPWQVGSLEDITAFGNRGELEILSYRKEAAPVAARILAGGGRAPLHCLANLLRLDGDPFAFNRIYFAPAIGAALTRADFTDRVIYRNVETRLGLRISGAETTVDAIAADDEIAGRLRCDPGHPILRLAFLFLDEAGTPVQLSVNHYRGDGFTLSYRFRRTP